MDIDMTAIKEAMARRGVGGQSMPMMDQMSQPTGTTPLGGPTTPVVTPPTAPPTALANTANTMMPQPARMRPAANLGGQMDLETKSMAKNLIQKLMNVL